MNNIEMTKHSRFNEWLANYKHKKKIKFDIQVAELLDISEVYFSKLVNGHAFLSPRLANKIYKLDNSYSVDYLLGKVKTKNMFEDENNKYQSAVRKVNLIKTYLFNNNYSTDYDKLIDYYTSDSENNISINLYTLNPYNKVSQLEIKRLEKALRLSEDVFLTMLDIAKDAD